MGDGCLGDCGNVRNCSRVCPEAVPVAESIAAVGRGMLHRLQGG